MVDYPEFTITTLCPSFARPIRSAALLEGCPADADALTSLSFLLQKCRGMDLADCLQLGVLEDFDAVWIAGGRSVGFDADELSTLAGIPVFIHPDGQFAAEPGGLSLLDAEAPGMVCDLGQTSLKISWNARRWIFPRDVLALPIKTDGESLQTKGENRRQLRKFIAECLRHAVEESNMGFPDKVVFALPSALDKFGQPAGSSYVGMKDDTQLVPDALELAGFSGGTIVLVNDAVLVALSVLQDERVFDFSQVLVITLGHAVGMVILDPMAFFVPSDSIPD